MHCLQSIFGVMLEGFEFSTPPHKTMDNLLNLLMLDIELSIYFFI